MAGLSLRRRQKGYGRLQRPDLLGQVLIILFIASGEASEVASPDTSHGMGPSPRPTSCQPQSLCQPDLSLKPDPSHTPTIDQCHIISTPVISPPQQTIDTGTIDWTGVLGGE